MNSPDKSRFFYGYVIVAACFVVLYMLWGMVLNTLPVFLKPIVEDMDWGRGAFMVALISGGLGIAVSAPIAGKMIDRIGARPVMAFGAILIGLGLIAGSRINHLWQLYTIFIFIGIGLMCSTVIPCSLLIGNWFVSRRGLAMSAAFVGTSFGGMIMSPIAEWIIRNYSWRTAFAFSGGSILIVVLPVVLLLIRTHPSEMGLEPFASGGSENDKGKDVWGVGVKEAFSIPAFWQIAVIMLIMGIVAGGVANHCVAYFDDVGHSSQRAARAWSLVMLVMVFGKFSFGPAADRFGSKNSMAVACLLFAIAIGLLPFARSYSIVMLFAVIWGFASGAPLVLNALLTSDYLGMKNFGAIYGILNIMANLGGSLGPAGAGFYFESKGTYLPVFYLFIVLMLVAGVVALLTKPVSKNTSVIDETQAA
jgi:MFS family permease